MPMRPPAAALAALVLSACTPAMELGRARTLEQGTWELGGVLGVSGLRETRSLADPDPTGGLQILLPLPPAELSAAYGLAPRLELDARLALFAAQLGLKAGLVRSERFDLAVSAAVIADAFGRPDDPATRARLALIAGVPLGRRFEVDLAPQLSWPLDTGMRGPELAGATGSIHYWPPGGAGRIGLAVSVLRYDAPRPGPGEGAEGNYVGVGIVVATGPSAARR